MGDAPMELGSSPEYKLHGVVGFIGCGNMAKAIAFPLFKKGVLDPAQVIVSARSQNNSKDWAQLGCATSTKNEDVISKASIVMWAVKPQLYPACVAALQNSLKSSGFTYPDGGKPIYHISVMAGVPLDKFHKDMEILMEGTGAIPRSIRTMPNIGLKVSCGVAVFTGLPDITDEERHIVNSFYKPTGICFEVLESQINAYIGLFGSGIGFMFPILEALSDGAVKMGIPRNISLEIAAQTMKGAGELILQEKLHPAVMKDQVCSPGGTTICGVAALEAAGVRAGIISAVEAAALKGQQLAGNPSK